MKQYAGLRAERVRELKQLQRENTELMRHNEKLSRQLQEMTEAAHSARSPSCPAAWKPAGSGNDSTLVA
jgi:cell division septum initiation protein DivIVA